MSAALDDSQFFSQKVTEKWESYEVSVETIKSISKSQNWDE